MHFSYLKSERVNLHLLQESASRELFTLLNKIEGKKCLILDEGLMGPIGLVTVPSMFSDRGIKLLKLDGNPINYWLREEDMHLVYVVRPNAQQMQLIVQQLKSPDSNKSQNKAGQQKSLPTTGRFHIYFVPRKSRLCLNYLESKEVLDLFGQLEELLWNFYPLDSDVLSMEMANAYRDAVMEKDSTVLYQAAMGLVQLQYQFGRIPKIYGKGTLAQEVWDRAKQLGTEEKLLSNVDKGAIDQLILLDRSIDLMSMCATQLTYEGLIDEFYGIRQNRLLLSAELLKAREDGDRESPIQLEINSAASTSGVSLADKKTVFLNSEQKLYTELRDKNFNEVGQILTVNAKNICQQMNTPSSGQDTTVQDMKRLVDRLPHLLAQKQSIALHTSIAESIRAFLDAPEFHEDLSVEQEFMMCEDVDKPNGHIEDLIAKKSNLENVLRLICLQCTAASGFKSKVLNYYKRELVQVYGIEILLKISNLERAGLLYGQQQSAAAAAASVVVVGRPYANLRKLLNLTVEEVVEVNPKDISYVHSFYAPLTIRIIEQSLKPLGWQTLKSILNYLPGPTLEDFQTKLIGIGGRHHHHHHYHHLMANSSSSSSNEANTTLLNVPRVIMIFFIGGCTYAEIAALRFLSKQEDNNVRFVIATTKILNKHSFLETILA